MNRLLVSAVVVGLLFVSQIGHAAKLKQPVAVPSVLVGPEAILPAPAPQAVTPPIVINVPDPTAGMFPNGSSHPVATPSIRYRSLGERRSTLDDKPGVSLVVAVKNPQSGCVVNVPICVPPCCLDQPCIDSRCGLFHRGIVNYDYKCGFRIVFVFDRAGDLLVTYHY